MIIYRGSASVLSVKNGTPNELDGLLSIATFGTSIQKHSLTASRT
jgi:hypothetical protein